MRPDVPEAGRLMGGGDGGGVDRRAFLGDVSRLAGLSASLSLIPQLSMASTWMAEMDDPDPAAVPSNIGKIYRGDFWSRPRWVWLRRPATGEEIRCTYAADGRIIQSEYERLSWFLRDPRMERHISDLRRAGVAVPQKYYGAIGMSLVLLDILYATNGWLEYFRMSRPLIITSAFRHTWTNDRTEGAVKGSIHEQGGAADLVVPDVPAANVSQFGAWLRAGGIGFYPSKGFTHVDHGRVRFWKS